MLETLASAGSFLSSLGSLGSAFGLGGGKTNRKDASRAAWESADIQKHLWYNQLPMLTQGAKNAGLHPLVAAGVNPASGPTVGVVGDNSTGMGDRLKELGQGVGRAAQAFQGKQDRVYAEQAQKLALEKASLENDLLRSQITTINRPTTPPISGNYSGTNQGSEYDTAAPNPKQQIDFGKRWQPNPRVSNAEDIETRYGELADFLWGPIALTADTYHNIKKSLRKRSPRQIFNSQHQSY